MSATLLLCDDHTLFREGLAALLAQRTDWRVVAEAADGGEALGLAVRLKPDVAVLDVSMPGLSGMETAAALRASVPQTRIVAVSMFADPLFRRGMLEAGAMAYVLKNEAGADLFAAIDAVLGGETYLSPSLAAASPAAPVGPGADQRAQLTGREREVLRLLAEGSRSRDIAAELGISVKTVETYRTRIGHKLRIESLAGLVKYAIRSGIVGA
jgi:DNA-binding NarL/FixJ family response regulator